MAESRPPKRPGENDAAWAYAAGVAAALLVIVPVALGIGIWMLLRNRLARRDWAIVATTSVAITVLGWSTIVGGYFAWLGGLLPPAVSLWPPPFWSLVTLGPLVASVLGMADGTRVMATVSSKLHLGGDKDSVVPTDSQRERVRDKVRKASDELFVIDSEDHSADSHSYGARTFALGLDLTGRKVVRLSEDEIRTHCVLLGATGSGKTETIKSIAGSLGDLGWSVIMLDLKEDTKPGGLRDFCATYARSHALRYQELALSNRDNEYWFNPLLGMTLDEAINTILSLQTFDDGYWQSINRTMIGQVCTLFFDAHEVDPQRFPAPDMYTIGRLLRQQNLPQVTREMRAIVLSSKPDRHEDDFSSLAKPSPADQQSATGLGARIVNMFESQAGRVVLRPGEARQAMDVCGGGFVYVGLNTLGLSELARVVSTSALLRLAAYAGARTTGAHQGEIQPTAVIIDEANWIDRPQVKNLLARARSAGIAVFLCTQGPTDWIDEAGNDWDTITQNTNVSVVMRQGNEVTAEMCADLIGKRIKTSLMSQVRDGEVLDSGSQKEVVDHIVSTMQIRSLTTGEAVVKVGMPYERVEYCAVHQRRPEDHARSNTRR